MVGASMARISNMTIKMNPMEIRPMVWLDTRSSGALLYFALDRDVDRSLILSSDTIELTAKSMFLDVRL